MKNDNRSLDLPVIPPLTLIKKNDIYFFFSEDLKIISEGKSVNEAYENFSKLNEDYFKKASAAGLGDLFSTQLTSNNKINISILKNNKFIIAVILLLFLIAACAFTLNSAIKKVKHNAIIYVQSELKNDILTTFDIVLDCYELTTNKQKKQLITRIHKIIDEVKDPSIISKEITNAKKD